MTDVRLRGPMLLALASGVAFVAVSALYRAGVTRAVDRDAFLRLRDAHTEWLDWLGVAYDMLFGPTPTFAAAIVLAGVLWRFGPRWSWSAPSAIVLAVLAEAIVKNGWSEVLQPRALIDGVQVLFGGQYHAPASFPSGHVTRAMFLAVIVLAFLPRKVSVPFALLALSTLPARMYTEAHHLSDVLGGASLGICVAYAAVWGVSLLAAIEGNRSRSWAAAGRALPRKLDA